MSGTAQVGNEISPPRGLFSALRERVRSLHYSLRTERAYVLWVRRFIAFHGRRHPRELGAAEVTSFLSSLAVQGEVAAATQNQALAAILFLYKEVMGLDLPWLSEVVRAKRPRRLPVVLESHEVAALLGRIDGLPGLMARLMYGTGMRISECVALRVKDLDLTRRELVVRDGKGGKDRMTVVPLSLVTPLREQAPLLRADVVPRHLPRRAPLRLRQARDLPYAAAQLRHPPHATGLRHPHHPGAPRPQGCEHDDDLHACPESRRPRRGESSRSGARGRAGGGLMIVGAAPLTEEPTR